MLVDPVAAITTINSANHDVAGHTNQPTNHSVIDCEWGAFSGKSSPLMIKA